MEGTTLMPWSYSGLLDDVFERHQITQEVDSSFFERAIVRNILFSGPILLNDGYAINHSAGLKQILSSQSLLYRMSRQGFVRVLYRGDEGDSESFASSPERLALRGINTSARLVARPDWNDAIKPALRKWGDLLFKRGSAQRWPNLKTEVGFQKMFTRTVDRSAADLGLSVSAGIVLQRWWELLDGAQKERWVTAPRSVVEDGLISLMDRGLAERRDIDQIMNLAAQAYHYNFGLCLSYEMRKSVVVDTTIGPAFEDLLDFDQSFEAEVENMPAISIPHGFPLDKPGLFDDLLDEGSDVFQFKRNLLATLDRLMMTGGNLQRSAREIEINEAIEGYRAKLAEHFSLFVGAVDLFPKRMALLTLGFSQIGGRLAVASDIASTASRVAGSKSFLSGILSRVPKMVGERILDVALDPNAGEAKKFVFRVADIRPRFASLAFNEKSVKSHVENIPKFIE